MEEQIFEKATFLPNPHVKREQCVVGCEGCKKMYSDNTIGDVCIAYRDPKVMFNRGGCFLHSNKKVEAEAKKKINPIKASKRLRRKK